MAYKIIPDSVREVFSYDPETGVIRWKVARGRAKAGDIAGTKNHPSGYIQVRFAGANWKAHRVAWFLTHGEQPDVIDHINHNESDNRLSNLRNVSHQANQLNRREQGRGIRWDKRRNYWIAHIGGRNVYTGVSILKAHFRRYMAVTATHNLGLPAPLSVGRTFRN
jgi:hypothetical protein